MVDVAFHRQKAHLERLLEVMSGMFVVVGLSSYKSLPNLSFPPHDILCVEDHSQDELSSRFRQEGLEDLY